MARYWVIPPPPATHTHIVHPHLSSITKSSLVMILHLLALSMTLRQILHCFVAPHQNCLKMEFSGNEYCTLMWYISVFHGPMFPSLYVPRHLCSPVPVPMGYLHIPLESSHTTLDPQPPRPTTTTKYVFLPLDGITKYFYFK